MAPDAQPLACAGLEVSNRNVGCDANGRCAAGSIPFSSMGGTFDSGYCDCLPYDGSAPTCAQVFSAYDCICARGSGGYTCNGASFDDIYDGGLSAPATAIYCSGGG